MKINTDLIKKNFNEGLKDQISFQKMAIVKSFPWLICALISKGFSEYMKSSEGLNIISNVLNCSHICFIILGGYCLDQGAIKYYENLNKKDILVINSPHKINLIKSELLNGQN